MLDESFDDWRSANQRRDPTDQHRTESVDRRWRVPATLPEPNCLGSEGTVGGGSLQETLSSEESDHPGASPHWGAMAEAFEQQSEQERSVTSTKNLAQGNSGRHNVMPCLDAVPPVPPSQTTASMRRRRHGDLRPS